MNAYQGLVSGVTIDDPYRLIRTGDMEAINPKHGGFRFIRSTETSTGLT